MTGRAMVTTRLSRLTMKRAMAVIAKVQEAEDRRVIGGSLSGSVVESVD